MLQDEFVPYAMWVRPTEGYKKHPDNKPPTSFQGKDRTAAAAAKSLQLCPTLCDPIDGSPLGSSVPGILLARILEWVANAWEWKVKVKLLCCAWLLRIPRTAAYQAPLPMGFSSNSTRGGCRCLLQIVLLELLFISCLVYHMFGSFTGDLEMVWWPSASWLLSEYLFSPTFYLPMKAQFLLVSGNFFQEHGLSHLSPMGRADTSTQEGSQPLTQWQLLSLWNSASSSGIWEDNAGALGTSQ